MVATMAYKGRAGGLAAATGRQVVAKAGTRLAGAPRRVPGASPVFSHRLALRIAAVATRRSRRNISAGRRRSRPCNACSMPASSKGSSRPSPTPARLPPSLFCLGTAFGRSPRAQPGAAVATGDGRKLIVRPRGPRRTIGQPTPAGRLKARRLVGPLLVSAEEPRRRWRAGLAGPCTPPRVGEQEGLQSTRITRGPQGLPLPGRRSRTPT